MSDVLNACKKGVEMQGNKEIYEVMFPKSATKEQREALNKEAIARNWNKED